MKLKNWKQTDILTKNISDLYKFFKNIPESEQEHQVE